MERSFARETGLRVGGTAADRARRPHVDLRISRPRRHDRAGDLPALGPGDRVGAGGDRHGARRRHAAARRAARRPRGHRRVQGRRPAGAARHAAALHRLARGARHDHRPGATNTIIIGVNTLLALIAVGFTVATVISGRVLAQRREIGLLKAIGMTPRGVVALLVGEYVGGRRWSPALLGLVAGAAIAPLLLEPMSNAARHADPERARSPRTLLLALALIVAAVARLRGAARAARGPAEHRRRARARAAPSVSGGASRAARVAAALHLPADRPAGRQGRVHEPLARAADRRRADDDGHHARRRRSRWRRRTTA